MFHLSILKKTIWGFLLLVMGVALPLPAQAYTLDVRNPYSDKMSVALVDYVDNTGWRCIGWFDVKPLSTRRINMPSATQKNIVYLYAKTSEAQWSGEGIPSSVVRTVTSNAFEYYDGQSCPPGNNRRDIFLVKYELTDGFMYWSPE